MQKWPKCTEETQSPVCQNAHRRTPNVFYLLHPTLSRSTKCIMLTVKCACIKLQPFTRSEKMLLKRSECYSNCIFNYFSLFFWYLNNFLFPSWFFTWKSPSLVYTCTSSLSGIKKVLFLFSWIIMKRKCWITPVTKQKYLLPCV